MTLKTKATGRKSSTDDLPTSTEAKQSKAKQSKAKQSKAKQSKAKRKLSSAAGHMTRAPTPSLVRSSPSSQSAYRYNSILQRTALIISVDRSLEPCMV
jgi:hypothetical protein